MALEVFMSYSHKDRTLRDELATHLSNLRRQGLISDWFDGDIAPGTEWKEQMLAHLNKAQLILLLISADFMASEFCYSIEMQQAIARHQTKQAHVIPIILRRVGFRRALTVNALISTALVAACATFMPGVSFVWIVAVLTLGGFFRSLEFTSINTIAYADVDHRVLSRATSLIAVGQQLSISIGVAVGALVIDVTLWWRGHDTITAADFQPAWLTVAAISALSCLVFWRMPSDAGAELAQRAPVPTPAPTASKDEKLG